MRLILFVCAVGLIATSAHAQTPCKNSRGILQRSIAYHDPSDGWKNAAFKIHIQEPRSETPTRYSVVAFDRNTGEFSIDRGDSASFTRVDIKNTPRYKRFYDFMYGLPMSASDNEVMIGSEIDVIMFNGMKAYGIPFELQRPLISKKWKLFFSMEDFSLLGVELYSENEPGAGERIVFDGSIDLQTVHVPQFRHWYTLSDEYLGSDIIVKVIP